MARRNVRRIQWIPNDNDCLAALRRGRANLHRKAAELSAMCIVSVTVVTHAPGEAKPTVWPSAPEDTAILQRYAATDLFSVDTMDHLEFLHRRIAKLKRQLKRQKAANAEAEANLVLHEVIHGHKAIGDVPHELLADFKKVVEESIQQAACRIYLRSL